MNNSLPYGPTLDPPTFFREVSGKSIDDVSFPKPVGRYIHVSHLEGNKMRNQKTSAGGAV